MKQKLKGLQERLEFSPQCLEHKTGQDTTGDRRIQEVSGKTLCTTPRLIAGLCRATAPE